MPGKHGPNRLSSYIETHETVMGHLRRGGLVTGDEAALVYTALFNAVGIKGRIQCPGPVHVDVVKRLAILSGAGANAVVQTAFYSNNAVLVSVGNVFRYDSPHRTHNRFHHKHEYDVLQGDHEGRIVRIDDEEVRPTLGEVVEEAPT
ncbi:MAG: hypothetical protein R3362_01335 [Rhodothermales bacterium]|nr:hypothetical protein [Rhodothermales bacterium]